MEPITYEAVQRNPELLQALMDEARRERAEAVYQLIIRPIKALFGRSPAMKVHPAAPPCAQ